MKYVIGIDEVGRGSLAGPVLVAALAVPVGLRVANYELGKLRDSKKLTPKRREAWSKFICKHPRLAYTIARVYPRQIEKRNISRAANLAALRAFNRLSANLRLRVARCRIFLDGGLYLGNADSSRKFGARTIVRGDEKIRVVAAASVVAKVSRDKGMVRLGKKYRQYGFEINKGYGTKAHLAAIKKHGPSEVHRLTFV